MTGFIISYLNWDRFTGGVQTLFNLHGLFFLWIVTFTVITMHEFSHGLTCCHFGGKVKEVGFMLIYFQPAFYCDVSDSWMFPRKRDRMWVTAAGGVKPSPPAMTRSAFRATIFSTSTPLKVATTGRDAASGG